MGLAANRTEARRNQHSFHIRYEGSWKISKRFFRGVSSALVGRMTGQHLDTGDDWYLKRIIGQQCDGVSWLQAARNNATGGLLQTS